MDGDVRRHASPQLREARAARRRRASHRTTPTCPAWVGRAPDWQASPPPAEPDRARALAPSRPEGVELGPVPAAASPLAAREAATNRFRRGKLIHALLQHLPDLPPERRAAAARAWLDRPGNGSADRRSGRPGARSPGDPRPPGLAPLFGPGSRAEVPLTGVIGGMVIGGLVDRLAVLPDRVLVADFKTNRRPPVAHRGYPGALSAPDGRLSRRAARHLPRTGRSPAPWSGPRPPVSSCCRTSCWIGTRPAMQADAA